MRGFARCGGVLAATLVTGIMTEPATAQQMSFAALRESALDAMGGAQVERIELTGSGWDACLGQAWNIDSGWARWEIREYRRVIDYGTVASVQTAMRRPAMDPEHIGGCGAQPGVPASRQQSSIDAESSWADQLPIWMTPHGFLHLAEANETSVVAAEPGWKVTVRVARGGTVYTLNGYYNTDFLLERIQTWIDNSVFGDMEVEAEFRNYRRMGRSIFPESLVYNQGGFATLDLTIDSVIPGTQASASPAPGSRRSRRGQENPSAEPYVEIGAGVFVIQGAYQTMAVEFDEFSVVIDGLRSDSRARELIRLTHEAIPGKDIRYVVITHSHFDHASGLRQFAEEGAIILTDAANVSFLTRSLSAPRTLNADESLNRAAEAVRVQGVEDRFVISDDSDQIVELHALEGGRHADDMLIAYLPRIKTIVEADLLQPWVNPVFGGGRDGPHPYVAHLYEELERLQLDYEQFVPVHRPPDPPTMPKSALVDAMGRQL